MRTLRCLVLSIVVGVQPAAAQAGGFGVKLGPTLSTISTELPEDPLIRDGMSGLLFADWAVPGPFVLVTEAGYVERGYEVNRGISIESFTADWREDMPFRQVSLAALAKLPLGGLTHAGGYLVAGPRFSALLCCDGEDVPGYDYRPVGWEASLGAGVEARETWVPLLLEIRLNLGLTDALEGAWRGEAYHRALDVLLGVRF